MLTANTVAQKVFFQSPEAGQVPLQPSLCSKSSIAATGSIAVQYMCQIKIVAYLKHFTTLQLVGVFCKGLLPGLLPLVWSIAVLKVCHLMPRAYAPGPCFPAFVQFV